MAAARSPTQLTRAQEPHLFSHDIDYCHDLTKSARQVPFAMACGACGRGRRSIRFVVSQLCVCVMFHVSV